MTKQEVVIFGASVLGITAYEFLRTNYLILGFCDNDEDKWGKEIVDNIEVISPKQLVEEISKDVKVVIASSYQDEITNQLLNLGIENDMLVFNCALTRINKPLLKYSEYFNLRETDIAIDCGANVGDITEALAANGATVYAFEPNKYAFKSLDERFKKNENVICIKKGVWDRKGLIPLYYHEKSDENELKWSIGSSLLASKINVSDKQVEMVEVIDITEFILSLERRVNLLKIDIEGAEYEVLDKIIELELYEKIDFIVAETHENTILELREKMKDLRRKIADKRITNISLEWI